MTCVRNLFVGWVLLMISQCVSATEPAANGTTIVGDQDAAVGLFLAPWKDETRAELDRPPGLVDHALKPVDVAAQAQVNTYFEIGRAYRRERLQRNR